MSWLINLPQGKASRWRTPKMPTRALSIVLGVTTYESDLVVKCGQQEEEPGDYWCISQSYEKLPGANLTA